MIPIQRMQRRIASLERALGRALDAVHESTNNVQRGEWAFAEGNLRAVFRVGHSVERVRRAVFRELRLARKDATTK